MASRKTAEQIATEAEPRQRTPMSSAEQRELNERLHHVEPTSAHEAQVLLTAAYAAQKRAEDAATEARKKYDELTIEARKRGQESEYFERSLKALMRKEAGFE